MPVSSIKTVADWPGCKTGSCARANAGRSPASGQQALDIPFDIEEIHPARVMRPALRFAGAKQNAAAQRRWVDTVGLAPKALADLEQAQATRLAGQIGAQRDEQTRQQVRAHGRVFAGDRIHHAQRVLSRIQNVGDVRIDKAVGDGLGIAQIHQQICQSGHWQHVGWRSPQGERRRWHAAGDGVVAVDSQHFLHQILFALDVETMAGRRHAPNPLFAVVGGDRVEVETLEDVGDFGIADRFPDQAAQPAAPQRDGGAFGQMLGARGLDHGPSLATDDFQQQTGGALDGIRLQLVVDAAFVSMRGVRVQAEAPRRRRHR